MRFIYAPVQPQVLPASGTVITPAIDITHMSGYCWTVSWVDGGAVTGSYKVQVSPNAYVIDPARNSAGIAAENPAAVWVDLPASDHPVTGSNVYMWNVDGSYYTGTRLVYTATSGAGTSSVYFTARGVL
jgi:hypothetical protein